MRREIVVLHEVVIKCADCDYESVINADESDEALVIAETHIDQYQVDSSLNYTHSVDITKRTRVVSVERKEKF